MKKKFTLFEKFICVFVAFVMLLCASSGNAALTKAVNATIDNWQNIAQNTLVAGSEVDVSGAYQSVLYVDTALTSTTATTNGTNIVVQGATNSSGNADWHDITTFSALSGLTAGRGTISSASSAGDKVFNTTSTTGFNVEGNLIYIKDGTGTSTPNSELVRISTFSTNANITAVDPSSYAHAFATLMYNTTQQNAISIPDSVSRVRVLYDNTKDSAGSTLDVRSSLTKITAI